jgi:hypothetical protein
MKLTKEQALKKAERARTDIRFHTNNDCACQTEARCLMAINDAKQSLHYLVREHLSK